MPNRVQGERFFIVPDRVIKAFGNKIGANGVMVYCVLSMHANQARTCYVSVGKIVEESGLSRRTVYRTINLLINYGLVNKWKNLRKQIVKYELAQRSLFDDLACATSDTSLCHQRHALVPPVTLSTVYEPNLLTKPAATGEQALANATPFATAAAEKVEFAQILRSHGLPTTLAEQLVEAADPALIREILAYCADMKSRFRNPPGAIRSMFKNPASWGFERTGTGPSWRRPTTSSSEPLKDRIARLRRKNG